MRYGMMVAAILFLLAPLAGAQDVSVINPKAAFPEGPVWHDGKLFYVEYGGQTVMTWDGKENKQFWKMDGCGPSAVIPDGKGGFLVTCYDSGKIARISKAGETAELYDKDAAGNGFLGPNDFCPGPAGGFYFTASGPWESAPIVGKIYYMSCDGAIKMVADDLHYANGVAYSAKRSVLFAAESEAGRIIQFKVGESGDLSDRRLYVRVCAVDTESGAGAYPDGIKLDSACNLWIGQYSSGRILKVSPKGELIKAFQVPSPAAPNLNFGPGEKEFYVMAVDDTSNAPYWGKVYKVKNE